MIHLDDALKQGRAGFLGKIARHVLFDECYIATTVSDFVNERKEVKTVPLWSYTGLMGGGRSALIQLHNVNLMEENNKYFMEDLNSKFQVYRYGLFPMNNPLLNPLVLTNRIKKSEYCRADLVVLRYFPKNDKGYLAWVRKFSNPVSDNSQESEKEKYSLAKKVA